MLASLAVALAGATAAPGPAEAVTRPGSTHFPRYKEIESNVTFWGQVFTKWTSRQIAFHDVEHLDLVYSVLSVDDIVARLPAAQQDDAIRARRKAEGERITAMLLRIADGHARTEEERRILKAIAKIGHEPSYASTLSAQVRSQRGLGDRFCEAAARAEGYRPMMSPILRKYGVPQELLALPLVESGYKIGAYSHAGASGIWQFMPATGRLYLTVGSTYDDRRDPRRSTEAAARMLSKTYENLGSWPLAITAYNHGPGGIARAVKEMGTTHFGVISRNYKGKAFGFASRNYYAEFLAAVDAMQNMDKLCGGPVEAAPYDVEEVVLGASASIRQLADAAGISSTRLGDLNPALSSTVLKGSAKVPRGYQLNLPRGSSNEFAAAFKHVDRSAPTAPTVIAKAEMDRPAAVTTTRSTPASSAASLTPRSHRVAKGETLGGIARRYGTTETTLMWMNSLRSANALKSGQTLKVPGDRASAPGAVAAAAANIEKPPFSKTMTTNAGILAAREAGEAAAKAAGTAVAVVPAAVVKPEAAAATGDNAVAAEADAEPAAVAEQAPAAESAEPVLTAEHKVGRGQTLSQIASMYRTSVSELKSMNGISDATSLQAGQVLQVRASASEIVSGTTVGHTYKVKSGDTLWSIAKRNDTSVETLKRLNPKLASQGLKSGQAIKVPSAGAVSVASKASPERSVKTASVKTSAKASAKSSSSSSSKLSYRSHRVQKGQTLSAIAVKYKTSVDTLKRINGIRDASTVQAGKTLKVPL
ncbi:MAG: LysM peptidoglycan-binding domain-containing protein [Candidatus Binatia bacterium]